MALQPQIGDPALGAAFVPTEEQRRSVRAMAGFGLPHEDIAVLIRINVSTLLMHFGGDLELGAAEGTAKVAQSLFMMATRDKNVAAAIFWMKARAGWREKHEVKVDVEGDRLRNLSDEELKLELQDAFEQMKIANETAEPSEQHQSVFLPGRKIS